MIVSSPSSSLPRFLRMESQSQLRQSISCSASSSSSMALGRIGEVKRVTKETNVSVKINLDGTGVADSSSGIPFLDHMLDQLASHGLFDVHVRATGDVHIDDHHTNEDIALAIGTALLKALGERKGINRFGDFTAPLDEALIHVSLDLSGRPYLGYNLEIPTQRVGTYDTQVLSLLLELSSFGFICVIRCLVIIESVAKNCLTFRFVVGGALFPVVGEYFWYDSSHPAARW
jgi:imidazoleglycerol-phosphate dehydratase